MQGNENYPLQKLKDKGSCLSKLRDTVADQNYETEDRRCSLTRYSSASCFKVLSSYINFIFLRLFTPVSFPSQKFHR